MAKVHVIFDQPTDVEGFENHYYIVHLPLAKNFPHIKHGSIHKVSQTLNSNANYYLMVEMEFQSMELLTEALESDIGKAVQEDGNNLLQFLPKPPTIIITDTVDEQ